MRKHGYEYLTQKTLRGAKAVSKCYLYRLFCCLLFAHLIGFFLYTQPPIAQAQIAALKIGIIQGNIPNKIKVLPEGLRRAITGYTEGYLSLTNQGVQAVLTPEAAIPIFPRDLAQTPLFSCYSRKRCSSLDRCIW